MYMYVPHAFKRREVKQSAAFGVYCIIYMKRIHMECWQNCEENELLPVNNWITTSTATITGRVLSESRLPAAEKANYKSISD